MALDQLKRAGINPSEAARIAPSPPVDAQLQQIHLVAQLPAHGSLSDFSARLSQQIGQPFNNETREALTNIARNYFVDIGVFEPVVSVVAVSQTDMRVRAVLPFAADIHSGNSSPQPLRRAKVGNAVHFSDWKYSPARILVAKDDRTLFLKKNSGEIVEFPIAVGRPKHATPNALYTVEAVAENPTWYPPKSIRQDAEAKGKPLPKFIPPGKNNPLGKWFIRLQNSIGIHGTNNPSSIGRAVSRGCIRMYNHHVATLATELNQGDQVQVVNSIWAE